MKINTHNAAEVREELLRQARKVESEEAPQPNADETAAAPAASDPEAVSAGEQTGEVETGKSDTQATAPDANPKGEPSELEALKAENEELKAKLAETERKWFSVRSVQQAVTRTQQENKALKIRVAELEAAQQAPEVDLNAALAKVKEVLPEAEDLFKGLLRQTEETKKIKASIEDRGKAQVEDARNRVISSILSAHPDANALGGDQSFWAWIDSHGVNEGQLFRGIIAEPWEYEGGAETVNRLLSDFKAIKAAPKPSPAATPKPAAARPNDVAPNVRSAPVTPEPRSTKPDGLLSEREYAALRKELSSNLTSQTRKAEIAEAFRKHSRASSAMAGSTK